MIVQYPDVTAFIFMPGDAWPPAAELALPVVTFLSPRSLSGLVKAAYRKPPALPG
jgi:hypothetical protein